MDQYSNDGAFAGTRNTSGKAFITGPSLDAAAVHSPRLQKQRSSAGMRNASHGQPLSSAGQSIVMRSDGASAVGFSEGTKARKGSIRNAVKKIFGRRGREVLSQGPEPTNYTHPTSRHAYHKSEPTGLPPPREEPEPFLQDNDAIERTLAGPYHGASASPFQRTSSPYAVQFPNSVRLKPMDLGNPFIAPPNQLRRRKTLPSLLLEEREEGAAEGANAAPPRDSSDVPQSQTFDNARDTPTHTPQRATSKVKKARRKSRSTDDLKSSSTLDQTTPRKRSDEIRHLRESFQPDVLRASGFTTRSRPREEEEYEDQDSSSQRKSPQHVDEDRTAIPQAPPDPFLAAPVSRSATVKSGRSAQRGHGPSPSSGDIRPSSGTGTDMSKELEDRVAKLEAGLQNFQLSLQRLTAERNRRTIIMGGVASRQSSTDMRTPSLLADTLADPLEPSNYEYEYGHTMRPSTSPQPQPQPPAQSQGTLEDPFGPDLPRSSSRATAKPSGSGSGSGHTQTPAQLPTPATTDRNPENFPMPLQSHPPAQQPPTPAPTSSSSNSKGQTQPYTFSSLYQMLADERSARRKLENQLKGLQREISDLHQQVTISNPHSTRSSYMLAGSSTRLQDLLRETEGSSPRESPRSAQRDSGMSTTGRVDPMISRFSGSESEAGAAEYDELATPYETYRTPREERSGYSLAGRVDLSKDNDMF